MPSSLLGGLSALRDRSRGAVAALGLAGGNVDNSATPLWVHGSFDDVRRLMAWAIALCLLLVLGESCLLRVVVPDASRGVCFGTLGSMRVRVARVIDRPTINES